MTQSASSSIVSKRESVSSAELFQSWADCRQAYHRWHFDQINDWCDNDAPTLMNVYYSHLERSYYLIFKQLRNNFTNFQVWVDDANVEWRCNGKTTTTPATIVSKVTKIETEQGDWQMILKCGPYPDRNNPLMRIVPVVHDESMLKRHGLAQPIYNVEPFLKCNNLLTDHPHQSSRSRSANMKLPRIAACTSIRGTDSRQAVPDWVSYHSMLGVSHFFLYINEPMTTIQDFVTLPNVTYVPYDYLPRYFANHSRGDYYVKFKNYFQRAQMNDCLYLSKVLGLDWILMTDVDEYVFLPDTQPPTDNNHPSPLQKLLSSIEREKYASVQFTSVGFGKGPRDTFKRKDHVLEYIYHYAPTPNRTTTVVPQDRWKHLLQPDKVWDIHVHFLRKTTNNMESYIPEDGSRLNHYKTPWLGPFNEDHKYKYLQTDSRLRDAYLRAVSSKTPSLTR